MKSYYPEGAFGVFDVEAHSVGADDNVCTLCMSDVGADQNGHAHFPMDCSVVTIACERFSSLPKNCFGDTGDVHIIINEKFL